MRGEVRVLLDTADAVLAFFRANPVSDPGHQGAVAAFGDRAALLTGLVARQRDGRLVGRAVRQERRELRREIRDRYVRHVVSVAELAAKEDPSAAKVGIPALNASYQTFSSIIRGVLTAAEGNQALLAKHGLGAAVVAELAAAVARLDQLTAASQEARRTQVGATAELEATAGELRELLVVLDGIARYRFAEDPDRLRARQSASNIVSLRVRAVAPPPPPGGGVDKAA